MISGRFDVNGRPLIRGIISLPRLGIQQPVSFLLDTGADYTCLNSRDANNLHIPSNSLRDTADVGGIGGRATYYREPATLYFQDEARFVAYDITLRITSSSTGGIPSLLGRDIFDNWRIEYDRIENHLECEVRTADFVIASTL